MKKIILRNGKDYQEAIICPECGKKCEVYKEYYTGDELCSIQCHCDCGCIFESYFGIDENDKLYYEAYGTGNYKLKKIDEAEEKKMRIGWGELIKKENKWYRKLWRKINKWFIK